MWDVWVISGHLARVESYDRACDICYLLRGRGVSVWMTRVEE